MTSIDPTGRLLAQLRQTAQEWRRKQLAQGSAPVTPPASSPATGEKRRDPLQSAVEEVAAISPNDPQARSKAFRAYLSAVLAQELGASFAAAPGFSGLVDQVAATMQADAQLQVAIEQAGDLLLKAAHPEA